MIPKRTLWNADLALDSEGGFMPKREQVTDCRANVLSSLGDDGLHYPVLDLDLTAYVVPSSTPGHVHLYIERGLTWDQYLDLLRAFRNAGLIEPGYYDACAERRQTFVRLPWVGKPGTPTSEAERLAQEACPF